jgi:hypothetical protein
MNLPSEYNERLRYVIKNEAGTYAVIVGVAMLLVSYPFAKLVEDLFTESFTSVPEYVIVAISILFVGAVVALFITQLVSLSFLKKEEYDCQLCTIKNKFYIKSNPEGEKVSSYILVFEEPKVPNALVSKEVWKSSFQGDKCYVIRCGMWTFAFETVERSSDVRRYIENGKEVWD